MGATTNIMRNWIDQMMIEKGVKKYTVDMSGSSTPGDGYMGEINFAKVTCDLGKEGTKVYDIVMKSAGSNEDIRKCLPILDAYQREVMMYTVIFPMIDDLQRENKIKNPFSSYPECYSVCTTDKQESILLSNLKTSGYVIHDRMVPQNLEHVLLVFRKYAQWHGSSIALKLKKPELFKKVTENMTDNLLKKTMMDGEMEPFVEKCLKKAITLLRKRGNTAGAEKIEKAAGNIKAVLIEGDINNNEESDTDVILHGDCWNNNLMFKYKENDTSKPIDVKFLDFQFSRKASLIVDLSYYLYTATDKPALDKFDYLLEEYHKTLTIYLQQFDINCDDILTLKALKTSWGKYATFGLGMCPYTMRFQLSQEGEVVDVATAVNKTMSHIDIDNIKFQDEYDRRVFNVYSHFAENFL